MEELSEFQVLCLNLDKAKERQCAFGSQNFIDVYEFAKSSEELKIAQEKFDEYVIKLKENVDILRNEVAEVKEQNNALEDAIAKLDEIIKTINK
jgi:L-fucose isomerase-like protein